MRCAFSCVRSILDLDVDLLATGAGNRLHHRADRLCDSAVTADDHTHIVSVNAKGQGDLVALLLFGHHHVIGMIHDGLGDVREDVLQIGHIRSPEINQAITPAFFRRALVVSLG